jgi:hypothetical protein
MIHEVGEDIFGRGTDCVNRLLMHDVPPSMR